MVVQPPDNSQADKSGPRMEQALGLPTTRFQAVTLITCGIALALLQTVCVIVVKEVELWHIAHEAGTGIWCGVLITTSGALASCSATHKTNGLVS